MVISKLKKAAVALAFLSTFGAANALTFSSVPTNVSAGFAVLTPSKVFGVSDRDIEGEFDDTYSFTAGSLPGVFGTISGIDSGGDLYAQYRFGVGSSPDWNDFSVLSKVESNEETGFFFFEATYGSLVPGVKYWINLKGNGSEASYSLTLAPVPEPETYALLLAGLGMVGTIARRRRIATAA